MPKVVSYYCDLCRDEVPKEDATGTYPLAWLEWEDNEVLCRRCRGFLELNLAMAKAYLAGWTRGRVLSTFQPQVDKLTGPTKGFAEATLRTVLVGSRMELPGEGRTPEVVRPAVADGGLAGKVRPREGGQ